MGFPGGSDSKESACDAGEPGSIPGSARSPGEGNGNPLQYSCLENPMDRGAWRATVHIVQQRELYSICRDIPQWKRLWRNKNMASLVVPCKESTCQCRRHGFNSWSRKISPASEQLSPCPTTTKPVLQSWRATTTEAYVPWSLCSPTREKPGKQWRPSTAKNNK